MSKQKSKEDKPFYVNYIDDGGCEINPNPIEISATDLGHAMQKAAAMVPNDAVQVTVFEQP